MAQRLLPLRLALRPLALLLAAGALPPASAAAQGTLIGLGSTPGGGGVIAHDITPDGSVVVGGSTTAGAFSWTQATGYTFLPTSPIGPSSLNSARAVSDDGQTLVGYLDSPTNVIEAFHWSASTGYTVLNAISTQIGVGLSSADTCSSDGSLVAGYSYGVTIDQPTSWDVPGPGTGAATALPLLPGDSFGLAADISRGVPVMVGGTYGGSFGSHAVRWTPGGPAVELPPPLGMTESFAFAASVDARVIYGAASDASGRAIVRWDALGRAERIPGIPPGATSATVAATSADGSVAVGWYRLANETIGFHWSEATGFLPFRELLSSRGVTGVSSNARFMPRALSANGNVIVGSRRTTSTSSANTAFLFRNSPTDPGPLGSDFCAPSVGNSLGAQPRLFATGSAALADNDLILHATDIPMRSFGILLASRSQDMVPAFGGGLGTLCLGAPVGLFSGPGETRRAGVLERWAFRVDVGAVAQPTGPAAIQPGESWSFQLWYRDRGPAGRTSNLTSAREIQFQ